ncbi:NAD-dependent epimerase/dehydratase family protein [Candidatus Pacebacteria bacterium]|nr:NAD-dependent epimerase/dehydratase family protein [Candidatus Paceibacterota bacterium]
MKNKTVLITGGAGFVGSHLCKRLLDDGHQVISLDNYFAGSKDNHHEGVEYREGHTKDIAEHIPEEVDVIYHLGEYARVAASLNEPEVVFDLNIKGTFAVLEFWRARGCKLVYSGSSTKHVGTREDGTDGRDLAPYTWMKAANTELIVNYGRWYDLSFAIVYFYNVYGPGERPIEEYGTVVETFKRRMLADKALQVREPGTQRRAFVHVEDTVDGIVLAGDSGLGDGYGLGIDDMYSLIDLAEMFLSVWGRSAQADGDKIEMLPQTKTTRETSVVDDVKIKALGWEPKHTLRDYIESCKKQ